MESTKIDDFKKAIKRPIPMSGIERKPLVAILIILIFGILCSILLSNWEHIERSGSLIVIVGVWVAVRDLSGKLDQVTTTRINGGDVQLLAHISIMNQTDPSIRDLLLEKIDNAKEADNLANEATSLMKERFRIFEGCIIIFGTFIWGYGSIPFNLIWPFSICT